MSGLLFWGPLLRMAEALILSLPTLLTGFLVAGVLRRLLGYSATRRLFGGDSWRAIPQAWALGMLLPVCSLGVIPILRELRRAGVSGGAILAFALTAPLFNPISILYGLTLADPVVIFSFSAGSLVVVTVVGGIWDWWYPGTGQSTDEPPQVAWGIKRMLAVAVVALRELTGPSLGYLAIGLLGVALLSVVLPHGVLQTSAEAGDLSAPLLMSCVAVPAYATPITAMTQVASMFQHGNSVGAAFALLVLGAGTNLGMVAWMVRQYGGRRTAVWFGWLMGIVLLLAYGVDRPLHPTGVEPAGHTHAFDGYCCPFQTGLVNPASAAWQALDDRLDRPTLFLLAILGLASVGGLLLRYGDNAARLERWLEHAPEQRLRLDPVLPAPVLGVVTLAGLIAASVFGCYLYYPPVGDILEDLHAVNAQVVTAAHTRDWEHALHWIPYYDDWTRKLQVSVVLRGGRLSDYQRWKARLLRDKLERLEHELEDREVEEARRWATEVQRAQRRLSAAYRPAAAR
ncbi:MAG: permease [Pirellulales bacterium]